MPPSIQDDKLWVLDGFCGLLDTAAQSDDDNQEEQINLGGDGSSGTMSTPLCHTLFCIPLPSRPPSRVSFAHFSAAYVHDTM